MFSSGRFRFLVVLFHFILSPEKWVRCQIVAVYAPQLILYVSLEEDLRLFPEDDGGCDRADRFMNVTDETTYTCIHFNGCPKWKSNIIIKEHPVVFTVCKSVSESRKRFFFLRLCC